MNSRQILEMLMIVKSSRNCLNKKKYGKSLENQINERCEAFCRYHNINITHGSAYKELSHKYSYYIDTCIKSVINNGIDKWDLRKQGIVSDKMIVDKLIKMKGIEK